MKLKQLYLSPGGNLKLKFTIFVKTFVLCLHIKVGLFFIYEYHFMYCITALKNKHQGSIKQLRFNLDCASANTVI